MNGDTDKSPRDLTDRSTLESRVLCLEKQMRLILRSMPELGTGKRIFVEDIPSAGRLPRFPHE